MTRLRIKLEMINFIIKYYKITIALLAAIAIALLVYFGVTEYRNSREDAMELQRQEERKRDENKVNEGNGYRKRLDEEISDRETKTNKTDSEISNTETERTKSKGRISNAKKKYTDIRSKPTASPESNLDNRILCEESNRLGIPCDFDK